MKEKSMKNFWTVLIGQFFSMLGSSISSFGLSIWVLLKTDNTMIFSLTVFAKMLPNVLLSPITGSVADRYDRKKIIIICDSADAIFKLIIVFLFLIGKFEIWMIILFNFLSSVVGSFQGPAFSASIPNMVEKENLTKANSFIVLIRSIESLLAPIIAGFLYPFLKLSGLFAIDFITYFIAIFTIISQNLRHEVKEKIETSFYKTVKRDFKETIIYLRNMGSFLTVIYTITFLNLLMVMSTPLLGPLVMSEYNEKIFAIIQTVFGISMVIGSLISSRIKTDNKIKIFYIGLIVTGIGIFSISLSSKWYIIAIGLFIGVLPLPICNSMFSSVMQSKIKNNMLGKVGALISALSSLLTPFGILLSGSLSEYILKPLLVDGGKLSNTLIGKIFGVGEARGIGLMFAVCGILLTIIALICLFNKKITSFEKNYPDVIE